ncbi:MULTISPECIES: hypothetical protein [unclassified Streptomyces]|uniref:hypothetical protein n=1 Tax=unclassified Streptomyces TaxID=2593676 RepID=UPI00225BD247|nr:MULTISPECIES: hypothetical protein [unclassified Streptomyces]MCX5144884.1 hypothetical protein [Streptomyces sp. NBC_00338]WRZ62859.1 hypothetical protein OG408_02770 [Streptomyces sp. NBC_01257]WSU56826.1 hypothetical protein OG450_02730 [Streptomyces sp. NBC_01104]
MRDRRHGRWSALVGVTALAFSLLTAAPALADEAPDGLQAVSIPADAEIIEATAPELGPELPAEGSAAQAVSPPVDCLGQTAAYGAEGCFKHYGDTVWAGDTEKDGMSAAIGIYTDYGRAAAVCINNRGVNTWATCKYDYWEKGHVQLRVFRYDSDTDTFYQPEKWSSWIPVDGA